VDDKKTDPIRRKARRAARAVTMGAALAAAGCSPDSSPISDNNDWDLSNDASHSDAVTADTATADAVTTDTQVRDAAVDALADADITEATCSDEADEICPEICTHNNDYDCCVLGPGFTYLPGGGCAVPGPFVPPAMRA
jgi:hypothetical protein